MKTRAFLVILLMLLFSVCPLYSKKAALVSAIFPHSTSSNSVTVANFTYSPKDVTVNLLVNFSDLSVGNIVYWEWDFGDDTPRVNATSRADANKTHVFAFAKDYVVSLMVRDDQGNSDVFFGQIHVRRIRTNLALNFTSSVNQGVEVPLTATLKDEYGNFMATMIISFYMVDLHGGSFIGSDLTDSKGRASMQYKPPGTGLFQVRAVFNGTSDYEEASSETKTLEVGSDLLPYAVLASVAVLIMSVVLVYIRFRRRKEEEEEPTSAEEEEE